MSFTSLIGDKLEENISGKKVLVTEDPKERKFVTNKKTLVKKIPSKTKLPTYPEFVVWFQSHSKDGAHFSSYLKQKRKQRKDTDLRNFYMILIQLKNDGKIK